MSVARCILLGAPWLTALICVACASQPSAVPKPNQVPVGESAMGGGGASSSGGGTPASGGASVAMGGASVAAGGASVAMGGAGVATGGAGVATGGGATFPATRDPFLWPFSVGSIWNTPIGSGAVYKPANLEVAENVGVDIQHILKLKVTDPEQMVVYSGPFAGPRCSGTTPHTFTLRVPDSWLVPDAGNSPYGGTPNSNFAFLMEDGETLFEGSLISRCQAGGPVYLPDWFQYADNRVMHAVRGEGVNGAGQGASGMSAMGGTLRKGELIGDVPIRHAIKINPFAKKYLHYSPEVQGFRWPARSADAYASEVGEYDPAAFGLTDDPSLVMGTLLAIPPSVTEADLALATAAGRKLFKTLQDYGTYFTEDAAWDTWDIVVERDAELEFEASAGFSLDSDIWKAELNKLMRALQIVDNNSATTIGGGGTPRAPLAPAL